MSSSRPFRCAPLIYLFSLTSCHVVERSQQCQKIADVFERSHAELAPVLPENPTPEALRHKANLYEKVAHELKALSLADSKLKQPRETLATRLSELNRQLMQAADAVAEARAEAEAEAEAEADAEAESEVAGETETDESGKPQQTGELRRSRPSEEKPSPPRARRRRASEAEIRHRNKRQKAMRKYIKAKGDIESTNRKVQEVLGKLRETCH